MPAGLQVLAATRLTRIAQTTQDVRELPKQLTFLQRTAVVPAIEGEITGRYVGRVQIADLVADDAQALTYVTGKMTFESNQVPNIKHGAALTQGWLNQLHALQQSGNLKGDGGIWSNFENLTTASLVLGIRQRMEALIVAMFCDNLTYNRFGIILNGLTWGMPADLKVTVTTAWTDATNATPVSDTWAVRRTAQVRYGVAWERMTLSLAAFLDAIATTEFQNKSRTFLAPNVSFVNLTRENTDYMRVLAANVFGLKIELYDQRSWSQSSTGVESSSAYMPINKVILSSAADDNDEMAFDFANGIVTETIVASLVPTNVIGRFPGPMRGPISYATAPPNMNPPNIQWWGVARGFPRKHRLTMNAVLTVGNLTDPIPVGEPF